MPLPASFKLPPPTARACKRKMNKRRKLEIWAALGCHIYIYIYIVRTKTYIAISFYSPFYPLVAPSKCLISKSLPHFFCRGKESLWGHLQQQTEKEETSEMKYHTLKVLGWKTFWQPSHPALSHQRNVWGRWKIKKKEINNFAFRENLNLLTYFLNINI